MTPNDPRWISRPISFVAVIKLMNITWVTWSYHVSCRRNSDVDRKKKKKKEEERRRRRRNWSNIRSCGCAGRIRRRRRNWSNIRSCGCAGRIKSRAGNSNHNNSKSWTKLWPPTEFKPPCDLLFPKKSPDKQTHKPHKQRIAYRRYVDQWQIQLFEKGI